MATYEYRTADDKAATLEANDDASALAALATRGDRAPTSGLLRRAAASPPTEPPPSTPTEKPKRTPRLVDRYAKDRKQISDTFGMDAPDPNEMRELYRKRAQAAVDAVNTKFAAIEAQDRETVDLMNRERRASNVLSGLSGSTVGAGRTIQTAKQGAALQERTAQEKAAEVQEILANAETRATEEFRKERELYLGQQKDKYLAEQTLASRIRDNAKTEIAALAGTMSYEELSKKSPQLLNQYLDELGTDETGLKALFLNSAKDNLVSDTPTIVGNKAVWFTRNADGTMGKTEVELPEAGKEIKDSRISEDGIQVLYTDGTYEVIGGAGLGGGGGGSDRFTTTQRNGGAANAGIPIEEFDALDADTQNFFINSYSTFEDLLEQRDDGDLSNEDVRTFVNDAKTLTPSAKEILLAQVPEDEEEDDVGWLGSLLGAAGSLFK